MAASLSWLCLKAMASDLLTPTMPFPNEAWSCTLVFRLTPQSAGVSLASFSSAIENFEAPRGRVPHPRLELCPRLALVFCSLCCCSCHLSSARGTPSP